MIQLALPPATTKKSYYVTMYRGEPKFENQVIFFPFYSRDYENEESAKKAAIKKFLKTNYGQDSFDTVTITEHNGFQIANKNEPYKSKSAIIRVLAIKNVPNI